MTPTELVFLNQPVRFNKLGRRGSAADIRGGKTPSFEPVHGSAPKYAKKNVINPTAMILSVKMMLDYFGMGGEAKDLEKAVADVYRERKYLTQDQEGQTTTRGFGDAVLRKLG